MIYLRGYFATCCVRIVRHIVVDVSWDSLFKVTSVHSQELGINKCKKDHPSENYFWITFEGSHNAAKMSRWVWTLLQGRPRSSEGLKIMLPSHISVCERVLVPACVIVNIYLNNNDINRHKQGLLFTNMIQL